MSQAKSVPLIVDLDGTLHRSDLSWKIFASAARRRPYLVPVALGLWALRGKAAMKCWLQPYAAIDPAALSWHQDVIDYVRQAKEEGRQVVLATGTPEALAHACNRYLDDLFDVVLGTTAATNLIGRNKAQTLIQRYGDGQFDYVGNSAQDLRVWPHCRAIVLAYAPAPVRRAAEQLQPPIVGRLPEP